jgi:hypothetical protein
MCYCTRIQLNLFPTMAPATITIASGATWQEVAKDRQIYRDATIASIEPEIPEITDIPLNSIPIAKTVLTAEEIQITEATVEELAGKLAKEELSAVTVIKAFLRRAALAQKVVFPILRPFLTVFLKPRRPIVLQNSFPTVQSSVQSILTVI